MKFDAYHCSVAEPLKTVLGQLSSNFRYGSLEQVKANRRYDEAVEVRFGGDRLYRLDGQSQDGITLVTMSGDLCADVVPVVRGLFPQHGVSRVDACEDYTGENVFEDTDKFLVSCAVERGLTLDQHGDWLRKNGRTRYIGAVTSPVRVRWYEKGYEQLAKAGSGYFQIPDDFDITRCRLETQYRPASRDKKLVASFSPEQVFASAEWTRWAYSMMSGSDLARPQKSVVKRSDHERRLYHLAVNYGRTFLEELNNCDGDLLRVGQRIFEVIADLEKQRLRLNSIARPAVDASSSH